MPGLGPRTIAALGVGITPVALAVTVATGGVGTGVGDRDVAAGRGDTVPPVAAWPAASIPDVATPMAPAPIASAPADPSRVEAPIPSAPPLPIPPRPSALDVAPDPLPTATRPDRGLRGGLDRPLAAPTGDIRPVSRIDRPPIDAPSPTGPSAADFQEVLLDLRFGRLSSTTIRAWSNGLEAQLPLYTTLELAEVDVRRDAAGTIRATLHPGARQVSVSADPLAVAVDGRSIDVQPHDIRREEGELFLSTSVLEELLGVIIRTDWMNLTTTFIDPEVLPLGKRLAREARWDRFRAREGVLMPAQRIDLDPGPLGGAVLDWSLSNSVREPGETLAWAMGLGARVFDGSLQVSGRSLGPISQGGDRVDASWETVLEDVPWLTRVRVGDGFTTGPRLRDIRGFSLTNAPYLRGAEFGVDGFRGEVGPGWDVELRTSGRVLDLTRADEQGAFALDIPLRYGENAVQVVAFGPHGEVVTTDRLLLTGLDRLPGGTFEWGLSGGSCRSVDCRETGNVDLRYGLNDRWTIQAGLEGLTRTAGDDLLQPYAKVTGMLSQALQLGVEGVQAGFFRVGAIFAPSPWIRVRGAHTAFSRELEAPVLHDRRRLRTSEADVFIRPDRDQPRLFLRASLLNQELAANTLARIQASATVPIGNLAVEGGIRREIDDPRGGVRFRNDFQFAALNGHLRVGDGHRFWIRGEVEVREAELMNRLRAQVGYQLDQRMRLELATGWQKNFGPRLTLTFSAFLDQLRSVVQYNELPGGPGQVTQFSQGTVYWNEATEQVSLGPGPGLQRGGISGYVFLDENGNGALDDGEAGLEGVRVVVGGRAVTTDVRGRHSARGLVPYQAVSIWTDSTSLADPTLVPVRDRVQVEVPPSSFGRVDIPVSASREVVGRVLRVGVGRPDVPVPYADLELENLDTGRVRVLQAFSDGEFYEAGVRPGRYEVRLATEYMERAGLSPEDGWPTLVVKAGSDREAVGPATLRVVRQPDPEHDDGSRGPGS